MESAESKRPDESHEIRLLKRLLECTRLLNATLDLRELTQIVLQIIHEELAFERGTVFVIDAHRKFLRSFVAQGVEEFEITLPVGTGIAGTVAESGEILDIPDATQDSRFCPEFGEKLSFKTRDFYCMPIVNGDGTRVGVLQLLNRTRPISERDKEFLASISVHLGIALERAWFHHQLKEKHAMEQEIRRVQHELAQLEKLSLIGTLTSGLLHEVRNPLTALIAQTTLMKEDPRMPAGLTARLTIIEYSAQRAMEVVKNFLGFSRKDEGTRSPANINDVVRKTIDLVAHECNTNKISVETSLGKIPPTQMNVGEIQQVLLNLFKNAIDAVSDQKQRGAIMATSSLSVDGETVRVEVTDNGPGIPEKHQAKLFEPFYTTKRDGRGTGLGLSTCRRLIETHGGKMGFTSAPGQGTTFWFEIPRNPQNVNAIPGAQLVGAGRTDLY